LLLPSSSSTGTTGSLPFGVLCKIENWNLWQKCFMFIFFTLTLLTDTILYVINSTVPT
jgi:hypothetical protein